jgi:uncharacterized protein YkwD
LLAKFFIAALFLISATASAQPDGDALTSMINAYRKAPGACQDGATQAVAELKPKAALAALRIQPGASLSATLAKAGYPNAKADAISVSGASTLQAAFAMLRQSYCRVLLNGSYTDIGASRNGGEWTVVLARATAPLPSASFASWQDAGAAILESVNAARATGRMCGNRAFPPAPPLRWNASLGRAALVHSGDMAEKRYFSHADQAGRRVGDRANEAGYSWARVGENLAYGLNTPQETVNGWLSSPSHCANIMNGEFSEMGAAFVVTADQGAGVTYWTQTFGKPRI